MKFIQKNALPFYYISRDSVKPVTVVWVVLVVSITTTENSLYITRFYSTFDINTNPR